MEYTVTIRKEHCVGREYMDVHNCPLCNAIREQIPNFRLQSVSGNFVRTINDEKLFFNDAYGKNGWCQSRIDELLVGQIKEHRVTFRNDSIMPNSDKEAQGSDTTEVDKSDEAGKTKEIIRYVSVPETIKKQKEELILN